MSNRAPLTIEEAAELLSISGKTVRRMLGEHILEEVERDARGRILISADSVDAAAVRLHRKKVAREEVREIAPALNANAEASLAAVQAFTQMVRERDERIYQLQQEVAELRAAQKYLPQVNEANEERIRRLEADLAEERRISDALRAQLDEGDTPGQVSTSKEYAVQQPWWRRLLGQG